MKKYISVMATVLLIMLVNLTGCVSVHMPGKMKIVGDLPQRGQDIYIFDVVSYEMNGQMEHVMVWKELGSDSIKSVKMISFCFDGLRTYINEGHYRVEPSEYMGIRFQKIQ